MRGRSNSLGQKDSIYCTFYQRTGACAHGEVCSKMHIRPTVSSSLLLRNMYPNPSKFIELLPPNSLSIDDETIQANFDEFYLDIYNELKKFGTITDFLVADNLCDHLVGNILVRFEHPEECKAALENLRGRFYAGRPVDAQLSPVVDFVGAVCQELRENSCRFGLRCNYIHPKYPSQAILDQCQLSHITERPRKRNDDYHHTEQRADNRRHSRDFDDTQRSSHHRYDDRRRYYDEDDRHYRRSERSPPRRNYPRREDEYRRRDNGRHYEDTHRRDTYGREEDSRRRDAYSRGEDPYAQYQPRRDQKKEDLMRRYNSVF